MKFGTLENLKFEFVSDFVLRISNLDNDFGQRSFGI
jgi:hypothetical protein